MPIAFCFLLVNVVAAWFFWGGETGLIQIVHSLWSAVSFFTFLPVPLFILMGEVLFRSGVGPRMIDALDTWLGKLPGRLGLLSVLAGTIFAAMSGSAMAGTAMLGSVMAPEVRRRGYSKAMSLGPIMASGALAIMIPPSTLGVILACLARVSVGKLLIAIIVPGLLLGFFYALYIVVRCWLQPSIAPAYEPSPTPLTRKLMLLFRDVLPLGLIIFLVIGTIYLGIATPSEAASLGTLGCFMMAIMHNRGKNWKWLKESLTSTTVLAGMVLLIIACANAFSRLLAFTGVTAGVAHLAEALPVTPIFILIAMQLILFIMGMFMEQATIMMVTIPIYMPIVASLGFNPLWFYTIFLLNMEVAVITPPFGLSLFVMKGVASPDVSMGDIYKAAYPFVVLNLLVMGLLITFPVLTLWLPEVMK